MVQLEGLRQAIHTAAEEIRAMSDDELVALALKASPTRALREELQHEERSKPTRKAKALPRGPKPEPGKPAGSIGGQQILDALAKHPNGITAQDLAKVLRRGAQGLGGGLGRMQRAGLVRRLDDGRWVVAGRQTGARKAARPVRGSDEEEGPTVKLSVASSAAPLFSGSHSQHAELAAAIVAHLEKGPATTVQIRDALDVSELTVRGSLVFLRRLGRIVQDRRGQPWQLTHRGTTEPIVPPAPKSEPRRLPVLEVGNGDRETECIHYDGCLDRFSALYLRGGGNRGRRSYEPHARCPDGCPSRELAPTGALLAIASSYGRRDTTVI